MTTLLDLIITLTPPPGTAPAGTLAAWTLRCPALGGLQATGLLPPLLTDQEQAALRWYLEEYCDWPYDQFAVRAQGIAAQLVTYGQRLYQAVFGSAEAQRIVQPWNLMPDAPRQVSLAGALPAALSLPWELLHDGHGFLALRSGAPVSARQRQCVPHHLKRRGSVGQAPLARRCTHPRRERPRDGGGIRTHHPSPRAS